MKKPIYMDYQATTPVDPEVIKVINDEMMGNFGNPHSRSHSFGWKAENVVDQTLFLLPLKPYIQYIYVKKHYGKIMSRKITIFNSKNLT